jgi:glycosyltransferase involved in cell wall biosynthesis
MPNKLKSILLISLYPISATGGGENYTLNCAKSISMANIGCELVAPSDRSFIGDSSERRFHKWFTKQVFNAGSVSYTTQETFREILESVPAYEYLWIHQYLATASVYDLLLATHNQQIIYLTNHGFEEYAEDFWIRYSRLPNHYFIEVSKYSAKRTQQYTKSVNHLYAGAWKKNLEISSDISITDKNKFVCVGRLLPHKAFEVAIDALPKTDHLVIIGPDSENPAYKKFLETKSRGKNVHIVGEVVSSEKDRIVASSIALLVNSSSVTYQNRVFPHSELLGLVVIEAILNNTLPITSSLPALKEVMSVLKIEHLVYQERNPKSLYEKMNLVRSLSNNEYRVLIEQAKDIIRQQFLWDNYWFNLQNIIRKS